MPGLRPDLIVRQVFRTAAPVVPETTLPTVLVGIHRQLEYRKSAGSFVGGQDNGDYLFPDLIDSSEIEPTTHEDPILRPQVFISNQYGVADVTDDATFFNLSNPATTPYFQLSPSAETTFEIATGSTGSYSATTGLLIDPSADFIAQQVASGDVVKVNGVAAFTVDSLDSDDQLTVTRSDYGPQDARVRLSAKDSLGNRNLDYLGEDYDGFATSGVRVGDIVSLNGWSPRTSTGGMYFTATDSDGERTVTATGLLGNVVAGQVVTTINGNNEEEPVFITAAADVGTNTVQVINVASTSIADSTAVLVADSRFFEVYDITATIVSSYADGFYSSKDSDTFQRTFTDSNATFVSDDVDAGDWIVVWKANSGTVSATVTLGSLTAVRATGSWIADGFAADMKVVCVADDTEAGNVDGVFEISTVTATTITFKSGSGMAGSALTNIHLVSLDVQPLFEVAADAASETSLTVTDIAAGMIPATQVGGPLVYSIVTPTLVTLAQSPTADVSTATDEMRDVEWPVAFTAGTLPAADDYVFNDEGVLLFLVEEAAYVTNTTTAFANADPDTIDGGAAVNYVTLGFAVGDVIQVITTSGTNDGQYTIASIGDNAGTNDQIVLDAGDSLTTENAVTAGTVTIQKLVVSEHTQAAVLFDEDDVINGIGLTIRQPDEAQYGVLRVLSDTRIQLRELVAGDEVTDAIVNGMTAEITVANSLTNVSYSVEKTLNGSSLTGEVLVTYAARRQDLLDSLIEVNQGTVADVVGAIVPANPLGFAAQVAVNNTPTAVYLVQVSDDTESAWSLALDFIKTNQVYNIVPLTQDEERLAEFRAHVVQQSAPEQKRERLLWQSHRFETSVTRWTMDSGESATVTYTGTPLVQTVTVNSTSGIVGLGVRAGDVISGTWAGYVPSLGFSSGSLSARVATISEVGTVATLTLVPDTTLPANAAGVSFDTLTITSSTLNLQQLRDTIAAYPTTIQERRVRNIYPDRCWVTFDDETDPNGNGGFYNDGAGGEVTNFEVGGWLIAAMEGAKRSGVNPSSPLKGVGGAGIQRLINPFASNVDYLDTILDAGNYLMAQPGGDGSDVETVRGVTTDVTDLNYLEDAVTTQIDNFARKLRAAVTPILGTVVLDDNFFDMFSAQQEAVRSSVINLKEIRNIKLISLREDPNRADTFLAEYAATPYFSAAQGDITIYI